MTQDTERKEFPAAIPAMVQIPVNGGAIIEFSDASPNPRLMQWTMTFDRKGRLLKATHVPVGLLRVNAVSPILADVTGRPLPPTVKEVDSEGNAVAETQARSAIPPSN
jgi:hypothetical protein